MCYTVSCVFPIHYHPKIELYISNQFQKVSVSIKKVLAHLLLSPDLVLVNLTKGKRTFRCRKCCNR